MVDWDLVTMEHDIPPPYSEQITSRHAPILPRQDRVSNTAVKHVDLSSDAQIIHTALKRFRCDKQAIVNIFTDSRYRNPHIMAQMTQLYGTQFGDDLAEKVRTKTHGDFKLALLKLILGPLESDVRSLQDALGGFRVDRQRMLEILLCRSNVDILAIIAEYRRQTGKDIHRDITAETDEHHLTIYRMILSASRSEETEPVDPEVIERKASDLFIAAGLNAVGVTSIHSFLTAPPEGAVLIMGVLLNLNKAQMHAMGKTCTLKYRQTLDFFLSQKAYSSDMNFWLQYIVTTGTWGPVGEAKTLRMVMMCSPIKDGLFMDRLFRIWWSGEDFGDVLAAYLSIYGSTIQDDMKGRLSGDYERLALALMRGMSST